MSKGGLTVMLNVRIHLALFIRGYQTLLLRPGEAFMVWYLYSQRSESRRLFYIQIHTELLMQCLTTAHIHSIDMKG
jgi:hypothetical protein